MKLESTTKVTITNILQQHECVTITDGDDDEERSRSEEYKIVEMLDQLLSCH